MFERILDIDVGDNVSFEIKNSEPIREEDDYGGLRYNIISKFDNIKVILSIDIATGDLITPCEIEYDYKMIFEDRCLKIMTYNIESIIAEKFQTVISRGILNSRMKDYYDLYYLLTYKEISKKNLKNAVIRTFEKRETDINDIDRVLAETKTSDFIKGLWMTYSKQHAYADNIEFEQVINVIQKIKGIINDI